MKLRFFRISFIILSVLIMSLIFYFSAQNATQSAKTSSKVIIGMVKVLNKDYNDLTAEEQKDIVSKYQFAVRKLAHFSLFASLGFFVMLSIITYEKVRLSLRIIMSFCISAIYAASDEIHQLFVVGRSCELRDFFIDFFGCSLGILISIILFSIFLKIRGRKLYVKEKVN